MSSEGPILVLPRSPPTLNPPLVVHKGADAMEEAKVCATVPARSCAFLLSLLSDFYNYSPTHQK